MKHAWFIAAIALIVLLSGCSSDDDGGSTLPAPIASFTMSGDSISPAAVTFTNTSSDADSFYWDFGNDSTSGLRNPSVVYSEFGTYVVTLIAVQSATGKADTAALSLNIAPSRVQFLYMLVETMPFTSPGGNPWDIGSGPDVFAVLDTSGTAIWTSSLFPDYLPEQLPLLFALGQAVVFSDFSSEHRFQLFDDDAGGFTQTIGSITYTHQDIIDEFGYVGEIVLQGVPPDLRARLGIRWI